MVTPAPDLGKAFGVMEVIVEPIAMATLGSSVPLDSLALADVGTGRLEAEVEATTDTEPEHRDASLEI
jgi:hypothetical protein